MTYYASYTIVVSGKTKEQCDDRLEAVMDGLMTMQRNLRDDMGVSLNSWAETENHWEGEGDDEVD